MLAILNGHSLVIRYKHQLAVDFQSKIIFQGDPGSILDLSPGDFAFVERELSLIGLRDLDDNMDRNCLSNHYLSSIQPAVHFNLGSLLPKTYAGQNDAPAKILRARRKSIRIRDPSEARWHGQLSNIRRTPKRWPILMIGGHIMWGVMPEAKNRATEILLGPEREKIWLLLLDYVAKLARRYGWSTGKTLPEGSSPDSVAKDVIIKVIEGERTWDPEKEPSLLTALKGMVHSDLGHLFSGYEARKIEPVDRASAGEFERTADSFPTSDADPEQSLLRSELTRLEITALDLIREAVENRGNTELEAVFLALYYADSPKEIADMTGLQVERVYALGRELDRIAAKISPARVARVMKERTAHE
jgi:hypothetical protein